MLPVLLKTVPTLGALVGSSFSNGETEAQGGKLPAEERCLALGAAWPGEVGLFSLTPCPPNTEFGACDDRVSVAPLPGRWVLTKRWRDLHKTSLGRGRGGPDASAYKRLFAENPGGGGWGLRGQSPPSGFPRLRS